MYEKNWNLITFRSSGVSIFFHDSNPNIDKQRDLLSYNGEKCYGCGTSTKRCEFFE